MTVFEELSQQKIPYFYRSYSALDRYFRQRSQDVLYLAVRCSLIDLAKALPDIEFPAIEGVDAAVTRGSMRVYLTCHEEPDGRFARDTFPVLDLLYDPAGDRFLDPYDVYPLLRQTHLGAAVNSTDRVRTVMDGAILISRYLYEDVEVPVVGADDRMPEVEVHRTFITGLFTSKQPWKGLALLLDQGFVERLWPQFLPMNSTDQSKGHHPEGNVWVHSLETLRYRKTSELLLSLALFLHDCGKPYSKRNGERRFDKHADIGAEIGRKFLQSLRFPSGIIEDVFFLVKYHMVPGALSALPVYRTDRIMSSPLFPVMLELYRCDLSSTYRGPNGYYEACKVYRAYLKHVDNPFRSADGKKLMRLYVE